MDRIEMQSELSHLSERMSDLVVEHSITRRRRDQVVVDLYRAGMDPEEIAVLAHLTPIDVRHLVQERADRPPRRGSDASRVPRNRSVRP